MCALKSNKEVAHEDPIGGSEKGRIRFNGLLPQLTSLHYLVAYTYIH